MSSKYESQFWQEKVERDCKGGNADSIKEKLFNEEGGKKEIRPLLKTTKHWYHTADLFLVSVQFS